jgi:hypothetical protein
MFQPGIENREVTGYPSQFMVNPRFIPAAIGTDHQVLLRCKVGKNPSTFWDEGQAVANDSIWPHIVDPFVTKKNLIFFKFATL